MNEVVPDETGRAAHDSRRALPAGVSGPLYARLADELGAGPVLDVGAGSGVVSAELARAGCGLVLADAAALPAGGSACTGVHLARVLHPQPVPLGTGPGPQRRPDGRRRGAGRRRR